MTKSAFFSLTLLSSWLVCAGGNKGISAPRETAGYIKPPAPRSTHKRVFAPMDPAMVWSRPRQVTILPLLSPAQVQTIAQERAEENSRRLQIGLGRSLEHPLTVNRVTTRADHWTVLPNGWRVLSVQVGSAGALGLRSGER